MNDNLQNPTVIKIERAPEFARLYEAIHATIYDDPRWALLPTMGIIGVLAQLQHDMMSSDVDG